MVSRLSGRSCSPRQVRYLLVAGGLATDTQRRGHGETRLFGVIDAALMRLAVQISADGGSPALARVALTYVRDDLIRAWKAGAPLALAIRGVKGSLEPALKARPAWAVIWIPLREIWRGVDHEIREIRERRSTVWMYRDVPVHAVRRN